MPRNGNGIYSLPAGNPVVTGTTISSTVQNTTMSDVQNALTTSIASDGQTIPTANLPMGGFKHTGAGAGTAAGDSVRWEQLFSQGAEQVLASAATTDIGAQNTTFLQITGTTTITSFGINYNGPRYLRFSSALTLTNGAALLTGTGANVITIPGQIIIAYPISSGWQLELAEKITGPWQQSGLMPTYVSATTFTLVGNQTADYHVNRRLQFTVTAGTVYGSIVSSTFTSLTTVVVQMDGATALDAGLSVVNTSILRADTNNPIPTATSKIQPVTATVASNALTATLNSTVLDFRSATLGSGVPSTLIAPSASIVVPSGATLGTVNAVQSRLALLAINNAGTVELAIANIAGGNDLSETGLISTTAISAAATAANVIYSTIARTNVPYRVVGYVESTQAVAGTWATAPSTIQGYGGQALASMGSLGYGQTWQTFAVGSARVVGTTYYNTTGRPIQVIYFTANSASVTIILTVSGVVIQNMPYAPGTVIPAFLTGIVPPQQSYSITESGGPSSGPVWKELR